MDTNTRQIVAVYVGDRSQNSARKLWSEISKTTIRHSLSLQLLTPREESWHRFILQ